MSSFFPSTTLIKPGLYMFFCKNTFTKHIFTHKHIYYPSYTSAHVMDLKVLPFIFLLF